MARTCQVFFQFFFIFCETDGLTESDCAKMSLSVIFLRNEMEILTIQTHKREDLIDITGRVKEIVSSSGIEAGICCVYIPHTTAAVTINENADPSVKADILMALKKIVPDSLPYAHAEGNSPAHVKSTLVGSSISVIIKNGNLAMGTWQGIIFCEFDGPRNRKIFIKIQS
jgi:secondary thiamine-phosphate synthase enzyme